MVTETVNRQVYKCYTEIPRRILEWKVPLMWRKTVQERQHDPLTNGRIAPNHIIVSDTETSLMGVEGAGGQGALTVKINDIKIILLYSSGYKRAAVIARASPGRGAPGRGERPVHSARQTHALMFSPTAPDTSVGRFRRDVTTSLFHLQSAYVQLVIFSTRSAAVAERKKYKRCAYTDC